MSDTYQTDFFAWANEQARLIREGRLAEADLQNIAEEIESMGRSEKRELVNRLAVLLAHLLKWQFQQEHRGRSWRLTIDEQRGEVAEHIADSPSLKPLIPEAMQTAYRKALITAQRETELPASAFPPACPYSFDQAMSETFWPGSE